MQIGGERLVFPEDVVLLVSATTINIAQAVRQIGGVRALAVPSVTADFFDGLQIDEQANWVGNLVSRVSYQRSENPQYITLLDTGVSRAHPLIQPALTSADRHAAYPAWGIEDISGHGTEMAGLALFGDLTSVLQGTAPVEVSHKLESVKLLPDAGQNPHYLLGSVTRSAINTVEQTGPRRRTIYNGRNYE